MAPTIPLYKSNLPPSRENHSHAGLWFDKFCAWKTLEITPQTPMAPEIAKEEWVKNLAKNDVGSEALLTEHIARRQELIAAMKGHAVCIKTATRFVTGLGYRHPVENGFAWHHALGTPYLPGSGLKGLARAWAELNEKSRDDIEKIFGPRGSPGSDRGPTEPSCGAVVFLEAIPRTPVKLVAEVMTPHYSPYYQGDSDAAPADYHKPIPIPFLAVEKGATFLAGVLPRTPNDAKDAEQAHQWLLEALCEIGAGAKTAVGYGRFEKDVQGEAEWRKLEEAERKRNATPLDRMRELVGAQSEGQLYNLAQRYLQKGELTDETVRAAFRQAVMESVHFAAWKKGQATDRRQIPAGAAKLKQLAKSIEE